MASPNRGKRQYFLGSYQFHHPVALSAKGFLPFPGVYSFYYKNPITGHLKVLFVGETDYLENQISYTNPLAQRLLKENGGNKDLLYYAYHIELTEAERQKIARELVDRYLPVYNLKQNALKTYVENSQQPEVTQERLASSF